MCYCLSPNTRDWPAVLFFSLYCPCIKPAYQPSSEQEKQHLKLKEFNTGKNLVQQGWKKWVTRGESEAREGCSTGLPATRLLGPHSQELSSGHPTETEQGEPGWWQENNGENNRGSIQREGGRKTLASPASVCEPHKTPAHPWPRPMVRKGSQSK